MRGNVANGAGRVSYGLPSPGNKDRPIYVRSSTPAQPSSPSHKGVTLETEEQDNVSEFAIGSQSEDDDSEPSHEPSHYNLRARRVQKRGRALASPTSTIIKHQRFGTVSDATLRARLTNPSPADPGDSSRHSSTSTHEETGDIVSVPLSEVLRGVASTIKTINSVSALIKSAYGPVSTASDPFSEFPELRVMREAVESLGNAKDLLREEKQRLQSVFATGAAATGQRAGGPIVSLQWDDCDEGTKPEDGRDGEI